MSEWRTKSLGEIIRLNYGKSLAEKKRTDGPIPVFGSNGIVGFHTDPLVNEGGVIVGRKGSAGLVHRSQGPFFPIDTTFYITASDAPDVDLDFLFYFLKHIDLTRIRGDVGVPGLNREMAYLETIHYPSGIAEQKAIARILSTVQAAIGAQERVIQTATELKQALMQKLFSEGLRGEPQKETEIGLVPESWEVVEIGDVFRFTSGKTKPKDTEPQPSDERTVPVYGGNGILGYSAEKLLHEETLILGRVGEYCGCAHLTPQISWATDNALYAIEEKRKVNRKYIRTHFEHLNLNQYRNKMGQPLITQGIINKVKFGLPQTEEQDDLADTFETLYARIAQAQAKCNLLQELFSSLLHELMTAKIRAHEQSHVLPR